MTTSGRFDLTTWEEEIYDEAEGAKLLRVNNTKTFEGGIAGTSGGSTSIDVVPDSATGDLRGLR